MEPTVPVNIITLLVAGVVSMVVGFLWYSPMLFGNQWIKLMGLKKENMKAAQKEMGKLYGLSFVASLITAFVLTHFTTYADTFYPQDKMSVALTTAFFAWLGFVMPVQLTDAIFGGRKWMLFAINTGYQFVALMGMGVVIGMM